MRSLLQTSANVDIALLLACSCHGGVAMDTLIFGFHVDGMFLISLKTDVFFLFAPQDSFFWSKSDIDTLMVKDICDLFMRLSGCCGGGPDGTCDSSGPGGPE